MRASLAIVFGLLAVIVTCATLTEAKTETEPGKTNSPAEPLHTTAAFKKGQDVFIRLRYNGGIKNWDAAIDYDGGVMTTGNDATITITDRKGNALAPKTGKGVHISRNARMTKTFDTLVNLAAVYDLSKSGHYIVEWGCLNVRTQKVQIEVVD